MNPQTDAAIRLADDIVAHLADGIVEPLEMLKALAAMPEYQRHTFTLQFIAQQMRLLTTDTTALAQKIAKAKAAPVFIEALERGSIAEKIRIMEKWGPKTNAETLDVTGETITRHVVELHDGPPPKPGDE